MNTQDGIHATPERLETLVSSKHQYQNIPATKTLLVEDYSRAMEMLTNLFGEPNNNHARVIERAFKPKENQVFTSQKGNWLRIVEVRKDENFFLVRMKDVNLYHYVSQEQLSEMDAAFYMQFGRDPKIAFEVQPKKDAGMESDFSLLSPKTCFDYAGFKVVLRHLTERNIQTGHRPTGREEIKWGKPTFLSFLEKKFGEETEFLYPEKRRLDEVMVDHGEIHPYHLYHSPSVMVTAGFNFFSGLVNKEAYKRFIGHCADLTTEFTHRSGRTRFLEDLIVAHSGNEGLMIAGQSYLKENPDKKACNDYHAWRGKVEEFANFVYVMEQAISSLGAKDFSIEPGNSPPGITAIYYMSEEGHARDDSLPKEFIGMIKHVPGLKLKVFAGNELDINYKFE